MVAPCQSLGLFDCDLMRSDIQVVQSVQPYSTHMSV